MIRVDRRRGDIQQVFQIAAFASKTKMRDASQLQKADGTMRKYGCGLRGIDIRQIDDGIAAVSNRCDRPGDLVFHGGFPALYKIT